MQSAFVRRSFFVNRIISGRAATAPTTYTTSKYPIVDLDGTQFNSSKNKEMIDFLIEDLNHLFDEQGIDKSRYADKVEFVDPLNKWGTVTAYLTNIQFLRLALVADYQLLAIKATAEHEITTRWTMNFTPAIANLPILDKWYNPRVVVTGVSIMGYDPDTMKFTSHTDYWDSIANQDFFSTEAAGDIARMFATSYLTPDLETPKFVVLRKTPEYEIREYEPYIVAEAAMDKLGEDSSFDNGDEMNPVARGGDTFNQLAGFLFGANEAGSKMKMTVPVYTSTAGAMQFVVGPADAQTADAIPAPKDDSVKVKQMPGGIYAARVFNGNPTKKDIQEQRSAMLAGLQKDGISVEPECIVARYNDPRQNALVRRNEVLAQLQGEYDLWFNTFQKT